MCFAYCINCFMLTETFGIARSIDALQESNDESSPLMPSTKAAANSFMTTLVGAKEITGIDFIDHVTNIIGNAIGDDDVSFALEGR